MIIIPDIHGRTFWKDAVKQVQDNEEIIFLGDYVDPYWYEHISSEDTIKNFEEIIEYAKQHTNVTLLLGNHDFMTYIFPEMGKCRTDILNADRIGKIYKDNRELFKIADYRTIDNINYTFSHGAILKGWLTEPKVINKLSINTNDVCEVIDRLNSMWLEDYPYLYKVLDFITMLRGGLNDFSSIVWGDYREHSTKNFEIEGWYQIFGHTQQERGPKICDYFACLDSRQAFRLENGKFKEITKDPLENYFIS